MLVSTIRNLEAEKGRPVYFVEIYQELLLRTPEDKRLVVDSATLQALFKDDLVLCDKEMNLYSLNRDL